MALTSEEEAKLKKIAKKEILTDELNAIIKERDDAKALIQSKANTDIQTKHNEYVDSIASKQAEIDAL